MKPQLLPPAGFVILAVLVASPAFSKTMLNVQLAHKGTVISRVCLIPAEATLTKRGLKGSEEMVAQEDAWANELRQVIADSFHSQGVGIAADYSPAELVSDDGLRQTVILLRERYASIFPLMQKKPGGVKRGRYSIGDQITLLPCAAQADAVVFVQANGFLLTRANKLLGAAAAGLFAFTREISNIWFSLVDAKSGDVLAFSHIDTLTSSRFANDPQRAYAKKLRGEITRLHIGPPSK